VVSDLRILTSLQELRTLPDKATESSAAALAAELLNFCTFRGIYEQICFIDRQGKENIRITYNDGNPAVMPREELQFQGNSPFIQKTFQLNVGEFSMSHFDLATEKGRIAYPPTPVIWFGMPVFDRDGRKKGVIMVNFSGGHLQQTLKNPAPDDRHSIFLLNSEGYWLLGPSPQVEWGFLYPDKKNETFQARFPAAWKEICAGEKGHFTEDAGLFTFITLYPRLSNLNPTRAHLNCNGPCSCSIRDKEGYYWKLVSFIPEGTTDSASSLILLRRLFLVINGLLFLLSGAVSWLLAQAHKVSNA
jgi:hypothetical protein